MRRRIVRLLTVSALLVAAGSFTAVARAGGGCHDASLVSTEASSAVVKIDGCAFAPAIDRVPVGTVVTFLNSSTGVHDVTGRSWAWQSPQLAPGRSHQVTFTKPGIYPYSCSLHPGMAGMIVAGDAGADASAAAAGSAPAEPADGATKRASDGAAEPIALGAAGGLGLLAGAFAMAVGRRRRPAD